MISDANPNSSIAMASSNPVRRDLAKKKRGNRSAKLKQCKLDARREQWLAQGKSKSVSKEEVNGEGDTRRGPVLLKNERGIPIKKQISPKTDEGIYGDESSAHHYSDNESSPSNSLTSHTSSVLGSHDSGINFSSSSRSSTSSGRSSSNGFCSGSMSEEDEGDVNDDGGCLDDWEAIADALAATDEKPQKHSPDSKNSENSSESGPPLGLTSRERGETDMLGVQVSNCQAWRPDDAFRPHSLPNLSKQYSLPLNSIGRGGSGRGSKNVQQVPKSCPICCEDLDCTDSSFLPCPCEFRLCLFCHKRILEGDGRCPGCRNQYNCESDGGGLTFRLGRSCSMITRS